MPYREWCELDILNVCFKKVFIAHWGIGSCCTAVIIQMRMLLVGEVPADFTHISIKKGNFNC